MDAEIFFHKNHKTKIEYNYFQIPRQTQNSFFSIFYEKPYNFSIAYHFRHQL